MFVNAMRIVLFTGVTAACFGSRETTDGRRPTAFTAKAVEDSSVVRGSLEGLYLARGPHLMVLVTHASLASPPDSAVGQVTVLGANVRRADGDSADGRSPHGTMRPVRWTLAATGLEIADTLPLLVPLPRLRAGTYRLSFDLYDAKRQIVATLRVSDPVIVTEEQPQDDTMRQ